MNYPAPGAREPPPVKVLYVAVALVVIAQIVGIYGLMTRKADLIFGLIAVGLLVIAGICALFAFGSKIP